MTPITSEGIILKKQPILESRWMVSIFTDKHGLETGFCSLRESLDLMDHVFVEIKPKGSLKIERLRRLSFQNREKDTILIRDILLKVLPLGDAHPILFNKTIDFLNGFIDTNTMCYWILKETGFEVSSHQEGFVYLVEKFFLKTSPQSFWALP
jgi:recombinational DNA repair protein (RecF pathway)